MQIKDLKAGDNIEVIELTVKSVEQAKFGKPPGNTPYQHNWLTDGTGDIRFSLFGDDVNKLQEGQRIKVISSYVKEYPAGSGKFQLTLIKDSGAWQIVSEQGVVTRSDDIVPAPVQIVSSDAIQRYIIRQTCLKAGAQIWQGCLGINGEDTAQFLKQTQMMYDWVMAEESLATKPTEPESEDDDIEHLGSHPTQSDGQSGTGPQATKKKPPKKATAEPAGEPNWSWFWTTLGEQGIKPDDVHALPGIESAKGWLQAHPDKTLADLLNEVLARLKPQTFEQSVEELYGA